MSKKPELVLPPKPDGKYSDWCEKKPWPPWDIKEDVKAMREASKMNLSDKELAAYVSHKHMDVAGLEFEMTGNLHIDKPVVFQNGLMIVPCFLSDLDHKPLGDKLVYKSFEMMQNSLFEYDCWMPIKKWNKETIRKSITQIDELLSCFSLLSHIHFSWKPKYHYEQSTQEGTKHSTLLKIENLQMIQNLYSHLTKNFPDKDKEAILSSIGWFSQAFNFSEHSAKFLFFILSIESLVFYIEEKVKDDSPLLKFKTNKITKLERKKQQIGCIEEKLRLEDKIQAIKEAYFDCVVGLKSTLKNHLSNIFSDKQEWIDLLFETKNGKSLYDLRSEIAHGRLNSLSPEDNKMIQKKIWDVQKIAFNYIITVIKQT